MADIRLAYDTSFNSTITLASLAYDSNLLQGRESAVITNSNGYLDYLISGKITNGTSPGAGTIEVWAVGSIDGTTWPDVFDGTDSAETVSSRSVKNEVCKLVSSIANYNISNYAQYFGPVSLASIFGGTLPKAFVIFVINGSGVALNATASNHQIRLTPVYETVG
jgi:hypothetical protein